VYNPRVLQTNPTKKSEPSQKMRVSRGGASTMRKKKELRKKGPKTKVIEYFQNFRGEKHQSKSFWAARGRLGCPKGNDELQISEP